MKYAVRLAGFFLLAAFNVIFPLFQYQIENISICVNPLFFSLDQAASCFLISCSASSGASEQKLTATASYFCHGERYNLIGYGASRPTAANFRLNPGWIFEWHFKNWPVKETVQGNPFQISIIYHLEMWRAKYRMRRLFKLRLSLTVCIYEVSTHKHKRAA